ncbi:MAG TPA: hypothetical protein VLK78_07305 [Candidatus Angelobacter sp.]|nr:hypothetical protein [Candidatus Angelobacter sp.]
MSRLAMKGFLFSALFLFFYKKRVLSTLLILIAIFIGMEGRSWSHLIKKGLNVKDWLSAELEN